MMMGGRRDIPGWRRVRHQALERDEFVCRKCDATEDLQVHHIIPLDAGGGNELENLIALCQKCHREWEMICYGNIAFDKWLALLPTASILRFIMHEELWRDDVPASAMRKLFLGDTETYSSGVAQIVAALARQPQGEIEA